MKNTASPFITRLQDSLGNRTQVGTLALDARSAMPLDDSHYHNLTGMSGPEDLMTTLKDLDTRKEHYVLVPERDVVIDIDLDKDRDKCLEEVRRWVPSYAELSRSGGGIHIHYRYSGDPSILSRLVRPGVECKVYSGKSAFCRRLTECTAHQGS